MRRWVLLVAAAALLVGCGGGGSSPAPVLEQEQSLDLGIVRGDEPSFAVAAITRPITEASSVDLAEAPAGAFEPATGVFPRALGAGDRLSFLVAFTPPPGPAAGEQEGSIRLLFRAADGSETVAVKVRLKATIETPSARLLETQVSLGEAAVGETVPFGIYFENTSTATPIAVSDVALPAGEFAVDPDAPSLPQWVAPGARFLVRLVYAPRSEGGSSSVVRVFHSASADPLEATLMATGIAARVLLDCGAVALDPATRDTDWVTVEAGPDAVGILIEALGEPFDSAVELVALEGPGGKVYANEEGTGPLDWRSGYAAGSPGFLVVALPDSSDPAVQLVPGGGTYRFRLRDASQIVNELLVRVTVSQRRGATAQEGTLDLHVVLADGLGIADRSDPGSDAKLSAAIRTIDAILGESGIRLGTVSFSFLESPFDVMVDEEHVWNLLTVGTLAVPEGQLSLFFVADLGYGVEAVAGADPGTTLHGMTCSGAVVAFNAGDGVTVGAIAAHAIGHYLGQDGGGVFAQPDEAYPMLRHPLLRPGLPQELVSPPERTDYGWIHAKVSQMAPLGTWCGTCVSEAAR